MPNYASSLCLETFCFLGRFGEGRFGEGRFVCTVHPRSTTGTALFHIAVRASAVNPVITVVGSVNCYCKC